MLSRVELPPPLARLRAEPALAALLLDVDGTLAPIVDRPEDAAVPAETRAELTRLRDRYGLVACISGRSGDDARRIVGVDGIRYVGSHGLELAPEAAGWTGRLRDFASTVDWPVEDKGVTVSFHWRTAPDQEAAATYLETVAARAREAGLDARFGRKVLELRPPVRADKGTAVRRSSPRAACAARSTRATTPPTPTRSAPCTRWSSASPSPSARRRRRQASRSRPTWSSRARPACWSCSGRL